VELLKIICTGTLEAYLSFESANRAFLKAQGVVHEETEHAVRLLNLCTLGTQQQVLTFKAIAAALQVRYGTATYDVVGSWVWHTSYISNRFCIFICY
jgi:hypothetical protein